MKKILQLYKEIMFARYSNVLTRLIQVMFLLFSAHVTTWADEFQDSFKQGLEAFREEDYPKRTIAHELVHPFVSVPVKRSDAVYSLAVEGFPSYFHLLALSEIDGGDAYDDFLRRVEHWYVQNKGASEDQRGNTHPPEIPLLEISAEQLSEYKDGYILWGRSKLFFNYLLRHMGGKDFARFAKTLFSRDSLTEESFVALCNQFLPGQEDQVHDWLYTNAYPENFRLIDSQQQ